MLIVESILLTHIRKGSVEAYQVWKFGYINNQTFTLYILKL